MGWPMGLGPGFVHTHKYSMQVTQVRRNVNIFTLNRRQRDVCKNISIHHAEVDITLIFAENEQNPKTLI